MLPCSNTTVVIHSIAWDHASEVWRVLGKSADAYFQTYHRVLNRAQWSSLAAGRILLGLLRDAFVPEGPVVMGLDETLERRRDERLSAKGSYRDPVRSSPTPFV